MTGKQGVVKTASVSGIGPILPNITLQLASHVTVLGNASSYHALPAFAAAYYDAQIRKAYRQPLPAPVHPAEDLCIPDHHLRSRAASRPASNTASRDKKTFLRHLYPGSRHNGTYASAAPIIHDVNTPHEPHGRRDRSARSTPASSYSPSFQVRSHPLPVTYLGEVRIRTFLSLFAALFVLIPFCYLPAGFVVFLVKERTVKAKHQQFLSGLHPVSYWVANYLWDMLNYLFIIGCVMIVFVSYRTGEFTGSTDRTLATFTLLLSYGLAVIPLSYVYSFMFDSHSSAQVGIASLHFVTGFVLVISAYMFNNIPQVSQTNNWLRVHVYRFFPPFNLGEGLISITMLDFEKLLRGKAHGVFDWDVLGRTLLWLLCEAVSFFALTLGIEYRIVPAAWQRLKQGLHSLMCWRRVEQSLLHEPVDESYGGLHPDEDDDVAKERARITRKGKLHGHDPVSASAVIGGDGKAEPLLAGQNIVDR